MIHILFYQVETAYEKQLRQACLDSPYHWVLHSERSDLQEESDQAILLTEGEKPDKWKGGILYLNEDLKEGEENYFKYQSREMFLKRLVDLTHSYGWAVHQGNQQLASCHVFFSPIGGVGVSQLIYRYAKEKSKTTKTLLLSLDHLESYGQQGSLQQMNHRMSDFLFHYNYLPKEKVNIVDFVIQQEDLHILEGPGHVEDIACFFNQTMDQWESYFKDYTPYDLVLIDGSGGGAYPYLIKQMDQVVLVDDRSDKWKEVASLYPGITKGLSKSASIKEIDQWIEGDKCLRKTSKKSFGN